MQNHQPNNFNIPLTLQQQQQQQYYYYQSQYLNATNGTASSMPAYPLSSSHARNRGETTAAPNHALPSSYLSSCFYPTTTTANVYHPSSLSHQQYHSSSYYHDQNNSYPPPPTTTAANCFPNQQQMMQQQHQQMQGFGIPPPPPPPPPRPGITANITTNKTSKNTPVTTMTSSILPIGNNCHISETNNNTTKEKQPQQQHHCDACNISFPTTQALSAHIHSHITCTKCSFSASKKVVSAHYKAKHGQYAGRGLKTVSIQVPGSRIVQRFKICVGNHPDDVQAWIEERKRRFPTRENVANKMQKRKRFREEGAVVDDGTVEDKRKRHVETMGEENVEGSGTTNGNGQETKNDAAMEGKVVDEERKCRPDPSTLNSIASLVVGYGSSSDEEEDDKNHNVESTDTVTTSLHDRNVDLQRESATFSPNAVCNTTNSSTEDDQVNNIASKYKTKQCRYFLRNGTCKNGDSCTYIHDMEQHKSYKKNADARKERQSQKDRARNQAKKEMNLLTSGRKDGGGSSSLGSGVGGQTLLRKLLENDIRRERSLCLQLLRYIVDCNYLQERRDVKEEQEHDL